MSLTSSSIANLINGISQQPPALRQASQAELQLNCLSSVVEGLIKRPPTKHVAKLITGVLSSAFIHTINRDTTERYVVTITAGDLKVFDIATGLPVTVAFPSTVVLLQDDAVAVGDGLEKQFFIPSTVSTIALKTTGITTATVVWEKSTTGLFAGEETTVRTDVADTDATVAWTSGEYLRGRVSAWTAGTIDAQVTWDSSNYLAVPTPKDNFNAITVADYTFVLNTTKVCAMLPDLAPSNGSEGVVFVKEAQYNSDYNVFVDGVLRGTFTTAASGALKTTDIAVDLAADLTTNLGAGWTVSRSGSTVRVVKDDGAAFSISSTDSRAGTALKAFREKVQRFSDLPTTAPTGFTVEVIGDNTSNFDNYYVAFEPLNEGGTFEEGVWVETVKPGIPHLLDSDTMPHTLVRQADGTFTFGPTVWGTRVAGDEDSAPNPSFVGRTMNDVFFFKNRLGFLADSNNVASRAGEFFDFFPSTVTALLDSDPIDVAASHNKVSILHHAVPFDEKLLLFSDQTQFVYSGGDLLTPKTASISLTTEFEGSLRAKPVNAGKNVFFAVSKGNFSGIREYFVDTEVSTNDAADVTSHAPQYISGDIHKLASATNEDLMIALTDDDTTIYPYKYYWQGNEKLQSSWSAWNFNGASILNVDFIENELFLIVQRADALYLEKMEITPGAVDPNTTYLTHLDRRITNEDCSSVVYDSGTNRTTWTLPYDVNTAATYKVVTRFVAASGVIHGVALQNVVATGDTIVADGDHSTSPVWLGETYLSKYTFSTAHIKEKSPGGGVATVGAGRLQLLTWSVVVANTGYFEAHVTHEHRAAPSIYKFTGRQLGSTSNVLGEIAIDSGTFRFPVLAKNTEVEISLQNETFLPFHFVSAEWEANYTIRSKRLTA